MKLERKIAIVTGASRGIGKATADLFEKEGATVIRISRTEGMLCDISKPFEIEQTVGKIVIAYKTIDILINNAGIMELLPLIKTSLEDWQRILSTNLQSAFLFTKLCVPYMNNGSIINVSSSSGIIGRPGWVAYSISKAGLITLTEALAQELNNVTVNCICPGRCDTELRRKIFPNDVKHLLLQPEEVAEKILELIMSGKTGLIVEISRKGVDGLQPVVVKTTIPSETLHI